MKLHLPCALRGALLACFALASTAPAWGVTDISINGTITEYLLKATDSSDPDADGVHEYKIEAPIPATPATIETLKVKENTTLTIGNNFKDPNYVAGESPTKYASVTFDNILVNSGKELTLDIPANTIVYIKNVNGNIKYNLGDGAILIVSADDCAKGSISTAPGANAKVYFTGGSMDISRTDTYWATTKIEAYQSSLLPAEWIDCCSQYTAAGSSVTYVLEKDTIINLYSGKNGGPLVSTGTNPNTYHILYWGKPGWYWINSIADSPLPAEVELGAKKPAAEVAPIIVDKELEIYRETSDEGNKVWHLHHTAAGEGTPQQGAEYVAVESLQAGAYADYNDCAYATMGEDDTLRFEGSTLTSSSAEAIVNAAIEGDGTHAIKIALTKTTATGLTPLDNAVLGFMQADGAVTDTVGTELYSGKNCVIGFLGLTDAGAAIRNITVLDKDANGNALNENLTLGFGGSTLDPLDTLTINANDNTFLATTNLVKVDGGTLEYIGKATDAIGALVNEEGTVHIIGQTDLTIEKGILADTLLIGTPYARTTADIQVDAAVVEVNTLTQAANTLLEADVLTVYDDATLGNGATIDVGTMAAGNLTMNQGSELTAQALTVAGDADEGNLTVNQEAELKAKTLAVTGTTTITSGTGTTPAGKILLGTITGEGDAAVGDVTLTRVGGYTATLEGLSFNNNTLKSTSMTHANINLAKATELNLGQSTDNVIKIADGTTLKNTQMTSTYIHGTGALTLDGTTHGSDTTFALDAASSVTLTNATILAKGNISYGNNTFTVTDAGGVVSATLTGYTEGDKLILTSGYVDLTGVQTTPQDPIGGDIVISNTGDLVDTPDTGAFTFLTDPGMVANARVEEGKLVYDLVDDSKGLIAQLKGSENTAVATDLLVDSAQAALETPAGKNGVISEIYDYLRDSARASTAQRQNALESLLSGSITMLADSQRLGVMNNINRLRNRVIQMGNPQGIEHDKKLHAWIEADGSYNDVDQDGSLAGYEYQSWGGTVGAHVDVGNFSFGAAISAAYGDLTAHSNDHAEGDHDTVSLNAFARHQSGRWTQLGILSIGRNEVEVNRSIAAPKSVGESKTYTADGDASGHTITGYYEAGYTISLDEDDTQVIQPLVSLMLTSARMGDFTETGSIGNAGLHSETQDFFYGTVGVGARYQVVLGENVNNRLCFLEARAKIVQDFGDETNETTVNFIGIPGQDFTVKGADVGRTGFQFGAGISVPVGVYTTLFADADADIRSGATSYGGSIGMRVEF